MLAGFLLIATLLSWVAVRSWLVLEHYVEQSRQNSAQALQLSTSIQELAERTVDLERSTRQFLVLNDEILLTRFDENAAHSLNIVKHLEAAAKDGLGKLPDDWRQTIKQLSHEVHRSASAAELTPLLSRLAEINTELNHLGRQLIDLQQTTMMTELEDNRLHLTGLVAVAVLGAFLVALAMSWWLSRPIGTIERAIERLGESQFDEPISVRGPGDLRRVGRRLDWLRSRLCELESDRERTLRHVSHELKTPLTALREGIALLQEEVVGKLEGSQREVVDILQHNVMALQRHIESLLRLNAASFDAHRLRYRPLALKNLLADVVRGRELQIQARGLTVLREAPPISLAVDGDKLLVVLDNLLSNAIDFSPENGIIRLEATVSDGFLSISCIDHGPGIATEDIERIFDPFVQGSRASPTPRQGSGVGLSIVRELMTAMGGQVQLVRDNERSTGAHFQIEMPSEH